MIPPMKAHNPLLLRGTLNSVPTCPKCGRQFSDLSGITHGFCENHFGMLSLADQQRVIQFEEAANRLASRAMRFTRNVIWGAGSLTLVLVIVGLVLPWLGLPQVRHPAWMATPGLFAVGAFWLGYKIVRKTHELATEERAWLAQHQFQHPFHFQPSRSDQPEVTYRRPFG